MSDAQEQPGMPRRMRTLTDLKELKPAPQRVYMRVSALEMEKKRQAQEREHALKRVRKIDNRLVEIDQEIKQLLGSLGLSNQSKEAPDASPAEAARQPTTQDRPTTPARKPDSNAGTLALMELGQFVEQSGIGLAIADSERNQAVAGPLAKQLRISQFTVEPPAVRLVLDRREELTATGNRPGSATDISLLVGDDGSFEAMTMACEGHGGAAINTAYGMLAALTYRRAPKFTRDHDILTNTPPGTPFRGPGGPTAAWALESAVDQERV